METKESPVFQKTKDLFFLLQQNLTIDAKNTIWHFLELAKDSYPHSPHPEDWDAMLDNLQKLMIDFAKESSSTSEMKLLAMHQNAIEMKKRHEKSIGEA